MVNTRICIYTRRIQEDSPSFDFLTLNFKLRDCVWLENSYFWNIFRDIFALKETVMRLDLNGLLVLNLILLTHVELIQIFGLERVGVKFSFKLIDSFNNVETEFAIDGIVINLRIGNFVRVSVGDLDWLLECLSVRVFVCRFVESIFCSFNQQFLATFFC